MATKEGWVGIADVAAHLQVTRDSIYRWVRRERLSRLQGRAVAALQALGSGRVGSGRKC